MISSWSYKTRFWRTRKELDCYSHVHPQYYLILKTKLQKAESRITMYCGSRNFRWSSRGRARRTMHLFLWSGRWVYFRWVCIRCEGANMAITPIQVLYAVSSQTKRAASQPRKEISVEFVLHFSSLFGTRNEAGTNYLDQLYDPPVLPKDVLTIFQNCLPHISFFMQSSQLHILKEIYKRIGDKTATEFCLQFVSRWIIDVAIEKEKNNHQPTHAFEKVEIDNISPELSIILSYQFFHIRKNEKPGNLKPKCRLVPYGNRDKEKHEVLADSFIAQFAVIRLVSSLAIVLLFTIFKSLLHIYNI